MEKRDDLQIEKGKNTEACHILLLKYLFLQDDIKPFK